MSTMKVFNDFSLFIDWADRNPFMFQNSDFITQLCGEIWDLNSQPLTLVDRTMYKHLRSLDSLLFQDFISLIFIFSSILEHWDVIVSFNSPWRKVIFSFRISPATKVKGYDLMGNDKMVGSLCQETAHHNPNVKE